MIELLNLCQKLLQYPSITPNDQGCIDYLTSVIQPLGFECHKLSYGNTTNLYARKGTSGRNLCFAGHVDVVNPGEPDHWTHPPFSAHNDGQSIWGRGAVDMKGTIAAFIDALSSMPISESISLLITSDEEGPATDGTVKVVEWLKQKNERIDFCLVGEPTSTKKIGDTIKIGRRGSLNATLSVSGQQGHVAYPQLAANPIPTLIKLLDGLTDLNLDDGNEQFQPSNLEITSIDVGNSTTNIIPQKASANFNVRFNTLHTAESLSQLLHETLEKLFVQYSAPIPTTSLSYSCSIRTPISQPFLTKKDPAISLLSRTIQEVCDGQTPVLSTDGGTSDARFIHHIAPTVELGLSRGLAHKVDERVSIKDLEILRDIYRRFIELYFQS